LLVRTARAAELDMAFALLPHMANQGVPPDAVQVACLPGQAGIAGAAAFSLHTIDDRMPGVRADILVLPSQRRCGIGRALLQALRERGAAWDIDYLHSWQQFDTAQPNPFLSAAGAVVLRSIHHFDAASSDGHAYCSRFLDRLRAAGRIPAGAHVVPLRPAHWTAASWLYAQHSGTPRGDVLRHIERTSADDQNAALSFALELDGRLIGFLLACRSGDLPAADLWITLPQYRNGWAALMLLQAASAGLMRLGLPRLRFHCNDEAHATLGMARRCGATLTRTMATYALAI
jgi:GNAT superfamily N-acetyltransferase